MSHNFTIAGFGFGNSIHTESVHGIGANTLNDFVFIASAISFSRFSIFETLIHACGFILICITVGHILNHSISIGISNSSNFSLKAVDFSTKKESSILYQF
jgi:hypothetical protein